MKSIQIAMCIVSVLIVSTATRAQVAGPNNAAVQNAQYALDKSEKEVNDCEAQVEKHQEALFGASGLISVTPEAVRQLAERLQTEKESMEVEEAGAKGRQNAIAEAIAKTTERLRARSDSSSRTNS